MRITVFVLVLAAKQAMLSDIPATVHGYAVVARYALVGGRLGAVTAPSLDNAFILIALSLIVGAVMGYISEKLADALVKK